VEDIPLQAPLPLETLVMERAFGLDIPQSLEDLCVPERTAILIYDMQVGIVSQIRDGAAIVAGVAQVLAAARAGGYRVFFTRHMSLPNEVAGVTQLRTAMAWQRVTHAADVKPAFLRDSPAFEIDPALAPRSNEVVIDKITMSAFAGTFLDIALRDCGLQAFIILGIALEIGIEPTVRHAMDLGYIPIIVTDACGFGNKAAAERSLATLKFTGGSLQTDVASMSAILRADNDRAMSGIPGEAKPTS
jgi:nicotinamidase-related amidase